MTNRVLLQIVPAMDTGVAGDEQVSRPDAGEQGRGVDLRGGGEDVAGDCTLEG